ncbi:MAG: Asp-tRNA(Asn)/Glu-tRNA(Gln) amidotransferase subunit GatB [Firmicutes bacterium]|nr:Asp-tRNA(Asn)/Glu-tRNA(Gln) amidotransferase subunit GatB [Bacillota bacterium]
MNKYKVLIGLEMHCEISETNTKVFSGAENSYKDEPNSNIRPVDMAFPGTLPVVNKEAIKKALMASLILDCKQPEYIYFERKNYYYPDLPKGFQITQETKPAPMGIYGRLEYECNGEIKVARINNIHLEEDSAATDHFESYSTINYNRAGVPLLELVTEPDFRSADEAVAFLETMRSIYQYAGISEADSMKGQVRCDVNVSIMDSDKDETDTNNWGTKIEIKNVNSFGGVREAINYEIGRQIALKESGEYDSMEQQTRRWDEESATTIYMRGKVDAIDYKYFVEPNIPKYKLSNEWLEEIRKSIPTLPNERKEKYIKEYGLSEVDAKTIIKDKKISDFYERVIEAGGDVKSGANWITSIILGYLNKTEQEITDIYLTPEMLVEIMNMINEGKISSKQSKDVLNKVIEDKKEPKKVVKDLGMTKISDENILRPMIVEILESHLELIEEHRKGRNVFDFFVGQVMKQTRGQADPSLTAKILREEIEKR